MRDFREDPKSPGSFARKAPSLRWIRMAPDIGLVKVAAARSAVGLWPNLDEPDVRGERAIIGAQGANRGHRLMPTVTRTPLFPEEANFWRRHRLGATVRRGRRSEKMIR